MTAHRFALVVVTLLAVLPSSAAAQRSSSSHSARSRPARSGTAPSTTAETSTPSAPATSAPMSADDAAARDHFEAGRAYYARAQYEDASREFAEAYRLSQRLPLLLNLSRALEAADRDAEAVARLDEWLEKSPADDPMRAEVLDRRTRLANEVEARRAAEAREAASVAATEAPPPPPPARTRSRALFYTGLGTLGLGVVAGGIAIGTGVAAHHIHQDLEARCDAAGNCPPGSQSDIDRGTALSRASTAMTFIGAAAAGTGLVLVLMNRKRHDDAPVVSPVLGPRTVGARLRLSF